METKDTIEAWIRSFRAGDCSVFSDLYTAYLPMLHSLIGAHGLRKDDGEAQSIASEAFHNALLHWDCDGGASFGTYAKRCVMNALRHLLHARALELPTAPIDVDTLPLEGKAEKQLLRREMAERTLGFIRSIASDEEYRVFYATVWLGEAIREYAKRTGKSSKQVENAKARLLKKLKQYPELYAQLTT